MRIFHLRKCTVLEQHRVKNDAIASKSQPLPIWYINMSNIFRVGIRGGGGKPQIIFYFFRCCCSSLTKTFYVIFTLFLKKLLPL